MFIQTLSSATAPDMTEFRETANLQLGSIFFGRLPLEIREMIYAECWFVSGLKQHVFVDNGRLRHSPCLLAPDEVDERHEELRRICQTRRNSRSRAILIDGKWASRFLSTWNEHWKCEEDALARDGGKNTTCQRRTLFLPLLLTCKRAYLESRHSLYASITLIFTDLSLAHSFFVASPKMTTSLIHSLEFSLSVPFDILHQHRLDPSLAHGSGAWAELCTTLSNLVRFAALQNVTIRLKLADDRYWWQVRERWILSAIRGMLARCLTVQLPESKHLEWSQPYQYMEGGRTPFKLERYASLPWMSFKNGRIEPRMDSPRFRDDDQVAKETKLQKAKRGIGVLVSGFKRD
ncbi:hypothetical protein F4779DRAFT_642803 [Xylariaceae sp. FL0662B]|nr:hypothetical protein F4779DRAFT_642803 [Xylariaceae sp. FL0662B]